MIKRRSIFGTRGALACSFRGSQGASVPGEIVRSRPDNARVVNLAQYLSLPCGGGRFNARQPCDGGICER
jgi:hypothetical protein